MGISIALANLTKSTPAKIDRYIEYRFELTPVPYQ